jgi:hypothetical protein
MVRRAAASGSRRRHSAIPRDIERKALFNVQEDQEIRAAARDVGMAVGAWLAQAALDAARRAAAGHPSASMAADVVAKMDNAVTEARYEGNLFNQAVRTLHITGQHSPELERHAAGLARAARRMEAATLRVARELLR